MRMLRKLTLSARMQPYRGYMIDFVIASLTRLFVLAIDKFLSA
jgi:hypothetical protein